MFTEPMYSATIVETEEFNAVATVVRNIYTKTHIHRLAEIYVIII